MVLLFGLGTVGGSIHQALKKRLTWSEEHIPFPWQLAKADLRSQCWEILSKKASSFTDFNLKEIHFVWSAGKTGMSASDEEIEIEKQIFSETLNHLDSLNRRRTTSLHTHLLSSAGGLYEGCRCITNETPTCPRRPYGFLKQYQEQKLNSINCNSRTAYRLSSVYKPYRIGSRNGLIPTLVHNSVRSEISKIWGSLSTLRDYVWHTDVAHFISQKILDQVPTSDNSFLIGSGKPTSILDVISTIERILARPIPFTNTEDGSLNKSDITLNHSAIPSTMRRTNMTEALARIYMDANT